MDLSGESPGNVGYSRGRNAEFERFQVLVKFYDADDAVVASGYDHVLDIDATTRWNYTVTADATTLDEPPVRHGVELSGPWW